ncbi:MAG TPA: aldose 1-epimerase, partial [Puia sp.]
MPFTISKTSAQDLNLLQLTDTSTGIRVKVLPDHGALLHEFSIPLPGGHLQAVAGYKNLSDLRLNHPLFYRSAKLSPFPCRIYKGQNRFEEKAYEFKNKFIDGSAIHGLLSDKPFVLVQDNADDFSSSVLLEYTYLHEEPGYPFDYKISVEYTLKKEGLLSLKTTATNLSSGAIPIADGWHPYFSLGGKIDDW